MKKLLVMCLALPFPAFSYEKHDLHGIWSMIPLNNGIANVVSLDKDGVSKHYTAQCTDKSGHFEISEPDVGKYQLRNNLLSITDNEGNPVTELRVISVGNGEMKLGQENFVLAYRKAKEVKPLCDLYR